MRNEIQIERLGIPVMNKVLVSITDTSEEFVSKGGVTVKSAYDSDAWADSKGFSVSEFIPRSGTVVALPSVISDFGYDYITDCELQVGDVVFWNLMSCRDMQILNHHGKRYALVVYQEILIRVREGEITPINGQFLLSAVVKESKALEYSVTQKISDVWRIEKLPEKLPVSHIERRNCSVDWVVGDYVKILTAMSAYRIEGEINKTLPDDLFCIPEYMILCDVLKPE